MAWKPVEQVYPDCRGRYGGFFAPDDYGPLLQSFGYEIVLRVDEDNWQGDSWVLFKDGDRYGYLCFGWGSCSGCDALQGCSSYEEIEQLRQQLHASIRWGTADELLQWFRTHDWRADWSWHVPEGRRFVGEAIQILEVAVANKSQTEGASS